MTAPTTIQVSTTQRHYPVVVGSGCIDQLAELLPLPEAASSALVVTEQEVVAAGHVTPVEAALSDAGLDVRRELVATGEQAKQIGTLTELWRAAAQVPLSRQDLIVAVGGGVVGDLAGFTAAAFNRGIAVVQVPTTLLGQVDAAIGGKTGINLPEGKNLVGAFHQPIGVMCDVATLATLPERILREGFGEIVKYGLIRDPAILDVLGVQGLDISDPALLTDLVERSVRVKAAVVSADESERGERAHLNLGHTYAHAVETLTPHGTILHGEAVAIGLVVALRLGARIGRTPPDLVGLTEQLLVRLGLPTRSPVLARDDVWTVMSRDKKADSSGVRFVVLDGLGAPSVITPDRRDVDAVLDEVSQGT